MILFTIFVIFFLGQVESAGRRFRPHRRRNTNREIICPDFIRISNAEFGPLNQVYNRVNYEKYESADTKFSIEFLHSRNKCHLILGENNMTQAERFRKLKGKGSSWS